MTKTTASTAQMNTGLLKRQMMVIYCYLIIGLALLITRNMGILSPDIPLRTIFTFSLAINLLFLLNVLFGWSRNRNDAFMLIPQILAAFALLTVTMHFALELRGAMQSVYFLIILFALFEHNRMTLSALALTAVSFYASLHLYEFFHTPELIVTSVLAGNFVLLVIGLSLLVYIGGHLNTLQQAVVDQAHSLSQNQKRLEQTNSELESTLKRLEEIAIRDDLTALYNRGYFLERLNETLTRSQRSKAEFHLALLDLDHFKTINDTYGHPAGDEILRRFADTARDSLRRTDIIARYGGEEFIILLPEGKTEDICHIIERLRSGFSDLRHDDIAPGLSVTLSAGIARWQPDDTSHSLTKRADLALYQAKHEGRNRTVVNESKQDDPT